MTTDTRGVRDRIAELMGWTAPWTDLPTGPGTSWPQDSGKPVQLNGWVKLAHRRIIEDYRGVHPIPDTIDGAVACFPKGWRWTRHDHKWGACKNSKKWQFIPDTGDIKADLFALALKCLEAQKASPPCPKVCDGPRGMDS